MCYDHPTRNTQQEPRAFTLVELLVVITIIGILIALLLPAVQAAREAARRMQCTNNLKQIALAMHGYHESNNVLPYGGPVPMAAAAGDIRARGGNWPMMILPFIEMSGLYGQINFNLHVQDLSANVVQTPIPAYACPTDSMPSLILEDRFAAHNPGTAMGLWYAGSVGPTQIDAFGNACPHCTEGTDVAPAGHPVNPCCQGHQMGNGQDSVGMFGRGAPGYRFNEIKDGLSNTIMVGETRPRECHMLSAFAINQTVLPTHVPINVPDAVLASLHPFYQRLGFGSHHPGGANFALGDGSVTFFSDNINYLLFNALGTRAGNEPVMVP